MPIVGSMVEVVYKQLRKIEAAFPVVAPCDLQCGRARAFVFLKRKISQYALTIVVSP